MRLSSITPVIAAGYKNCYDSPNLFNFSCPIFYKYGHEVLSNQESLKTGVVISVLLRLNPVTCWTG